MALVLATAAASPSETLAQEPWVHVDGARLQVRFQGSDSLRARRAMALLDGTPPLVGLGEMSVRPLLTIAPNRVVMDSLAGGRVPEWGAAVAIPGRMEIVVPGRELWPPSLPEEARILRHEWAHLALADGLDGLRIPRWFHEGYAEWAAGGWAGGGAWKLRVALAMGGAPKLDSLALRWPASRTPSEVAYLLSASVIEYLVDSSGAESLGIFFEEWRESRSFDGALRAVYGATPSQLESDWKKWAKRRYGWLMVVSHSAVFWAMLSTALVAMVLIRRRSRREQMARLRAGEPPDSPAYWDGLGEEEYGWEDPGR
ncbi:MAG: peptidase MA family metallohydrolase [Longimicrobiales bacterium]